MNPKLNGILLIDKPAGITSHDVVARVRRVLKTKSVGHAGTLDPFATGLLILLIGEATKISDYLRDGDKSYVATAQLGVETDTLDKTGKVLSEKDCNVSVQQISDVILASQGAVELPVPIFSAVKVKGEALYKKARKEIPVEAPMKIMDFYNVSVDSTTEDQFVAQLSCKKGGYIRAWAKWIGEQLGVGAHLLELRRLTSSGYSVEQAITLQQLEELASDVAEDPSFIPLSGCLSSWTAVTVKGKNERLILNGQVPKEVQRRLIWMQKQAFSSQTEKAIRVIAAESRELLAILNIRDHGPIKIKRVFKYQ